MAFSGNITVKSLGTNVVRITGATLVGNNPANSGTIGLFGDAGADIQLPASFPSASDDPRFTMADLIEVSTHVDGSIVGAVGAHRVQKGGAPFRVIITSDVDVALDATLEIYVRYHHSITR